MTTDRSRYHLQHFPSTVGYFFHPLAQEHIEDGSCLCLVADSVAFPERLHAASHRSELSLEPCVPVSGVG